MKFVTPVEKSENGNESQQYRDFAYEAHDPSHADLLHGSNDPTYRLRAQYSALPPPSGILPSNVPNVVQKVEFEMFVDKMSEGRYERYHSYTTIQSEIGSSSRSLEAVSGWKTLYPRLASFYHQSYQDSELVLLETNFNLLRELPPAGSQLGMNPFITINGGDVKYHKDRWWCSTHWYEGGILMRKRNDVELDEGLAHLNVTKIEGTNLQRVQITSNCRWWVRNVFGQIINEISTAREKGNVRAVQQAEEDGRRFLEQMSMMQEIWATPENDMGSPQRVAILLWKFRQTRNNEAATTTWRRLKAPIPKLELESRTQSPIPSLLPSSLTIDTSIQDSTMVRGAAGYMDPLHHTSFFVDDPESIITGQPPDQDSALSTPTPDVRSLPSSTATSFASSISEPFSLVSQDSAHYSQDSDIHLHDVHYPPHDSGYHSQIMAPITPDLEYLPQESCYPNLSHAYPHHDHRQHDIIYPQDQDYMFVEHPPALSRDTSSHGYGYAGYDDGIHEPDTDVTQTFARRLSYDSREEGQHQNAQFIAVDNIQQDFTGGEIHLDFTNETQNQHIYDQTHLASPPELQSRNDSFDSQYEEPYGYDHHAQQGGVDITADLHHDYEQPLITSNPYGHEEAPSHEISQPHEHSETYDQPNTQAQSPIVHDTEHQALLLQEPQQPNSWQPIDPSFTSQPLHHSSTDALTLHHPQPQLRLQHHIDSAQWKTHALWATLDLQANLDAAQPSPSEDFELIEETLKIETLPEHILEDVPGLDEEGLVEMRREEQEKEMEQGRILGEVSERLERELERERAVEKGLEGEEEGDAGVGGVAEGVAIGVGERG